VRGAKVIAYARHVLDRCVPLKKGSHLDSTGLRVVDNQLAVTLKNGQTVGLKNPASSSASRARWAPVVGAAVAPRPAHGHPHRPSTPSARPTRPAWPTWCWKRRCPPSWTWKTRWPWSTPADKVLAYGNWLGILKGTLTETSPRAARPSSAA
jgi:malate synthase